MDYVPVFMPVPGCFDYSGLVIQFDIRYCGPSCFVLLSQNCCRNFLRKLTMELPFDPAIPLLGLYPKSPETPIQNNLCTPMFIAAQFTIAKCWRQPKCPLANEWIKKLWYIYTMEFYIAERKEELIPFATAWMELESIMLSEISQVVREKYHMILPLTET